MNTLHEYIVCLGSNHEAALHLEKVQKAISTFATDTVWGSILHTEPEGTAGGCTPYQNQAVLVYSPIAPKEMLAFFKQLEADCGRTPESKSKGIIPMDIDILAIDRQIIRPQDLDKKYVQKILSTLLTADQLHTLYNQV